jgi:hypothetical protein
MSVHVLCPSCRVRLTAPDQALGRNARCPRCRTPTRVDTRNAAAVEAVAVALLSEAAWVPFVCPVCEEACQVRSEPAGRDVFCRLCRSLSRIPVPPPPPRTTEESVGAARRALPSWVVPSALSGVAVAAVLGVALSCWPAPPVGPVAPASESRRGQDPPRQEQRASEEAERRATQPEGRAQL